jgi:hypothetical protein
MSSVSGHPHVSIKRDQLSPKEMILNEPLPEVQTTDNFNHKELKIVNKQFHKS